MNPSNRIRYTIGPDQITLGSHSLQRGEWLDAGEELTAQALLPARVAEFGFESEACTADSEDVPQPGQEPAIDTPGVDADPQT